MNQLSQQNPLYYGNRQSMMQQQSNSQGQPQDNLYSRLTENDTQRKLEMMREARQIQTGTVHPQSLVAPPPLPIQVGTPDRQDMSYYQNQSQYPNQSQHQQQHPPQAQQHPQFTQSQPLNGTEFSQSHYAQNYQMQHPSQSQQQTQSTQSQRPMLHENEAPSHRPHPEIPANKSNHIIERLTLSLSSANEVNRITLPYKNCEITSARILSVAVPLIDYNVDEKSCCIQYSLNRLNAEAGIWQVLRVPTQFYRSKSKLLSEVTHALERDNPQSEFHYYVSGSSVSTCAVRAAHPAELVERNGLYFNVCENKKFFDILGMTLQKSELIKGPDDNWTTTRMRSISPPRHSGEDELENESYDEYRSDPKEFQEFEYKNFEIRGTRPMNFNQPAFLSIHIPELNNWKTTIFTASTEYGKYRAIELVDEDGVIDLKTSEEVSAPVGISQLTPTLTYLDTGIPYNTRGWPIHVALQYLIKRTA